MDKTRNEFDSSELAPQETAAVGAVVVFTTMERWPLAKQALEDAGCRIVYQRLAPRGTRLQIVEEQKGRP